MQVFYNTKGIGDVLMIPLKSGERSEFTFKKYGDVAEIKNPDGEITGYNIFHASKYFDLTEQGGIELTEELVLKINEVFKENGLDSVLNVDLSPKFVVGFVAEKKKHDNADKLSVCSVDVGEETLQIVCGAPNVDQGQKVVVAKVGAVMPSGLEIKPTELRGVPSFGMICSAKELGIPNAPKEKGILVLDEKEEVGKPFSVE